MSEQFYHDDTAYARDAMNGHVLDWSNQPSPYKYYKDLEPLPLPRPEFGGATLARAAAGDAVPGSSVDAAGLAAILLMAAGVTQRSHVVGLRTWASAGALYPCELYFTASGVQGLEDGLYHFAPSAAGAHALWPGPLAAHLAGIIGPPPPGLCFFISAMHWRSLWKYRSRAYRYCLLDGGHLLANLELACAALGLPTRTQLDFPDKGLGVFLGLDDQDESALAVVRCGGQAAEAGPDSAGLPPLDLQAKPLGRRIGRDRVLLEAHTAGELFEPRSEPQWPKPPKPEKILPLPDPTECDARLFDVLRGRRSRRNFLTASLDAADVAMLLATTVPANGPVRANVLLGPSRDLMSGAFEYMPDTRRLAILRPGEDRRNSLARACLGQLWVGQAAMVMALWADLEAITEAGGPRAYRHAMIAAGRAGQRLYLAATSLGLGCCGVGAFFDGEAANAAAVPEKGRLLYVLACGPVKGWPLE